MDFRPLADEEMRQLTAALRGDADRDRPFPVGRPRRPDEEVAELSLLLPTGQAAHLERLAHTQGLTVGQLFRRLIRDYLAGRAG